MLKAAIIISTIIVVLLQYRLWFSHDGLPAMLHLKRDVKIQLKENQKLTERNQALAAEVQDLKSGLEAVEARARQDLGLIKPGETFFQIIDEKQQQ